MGRKRKTTDYIHEDLAPPRIQEIDDAADLYVDSRDRRMALQTAEKERREELCGLMHAHELATYTLEDGSVVELRKEEVEKVYVNKPKPKKDDADANDS